MPDWSDLIFGPEDTARIIAALPDDHGSLKEVLAAALASHTNEWVEFNDILRPLVVFLHGVLLLFFVLLLS